MVHDSSSNAHQTHCLVEEKEKRTIWWLASESNYHKNNYEKCVIVRHRIKPQAKEIWNGQKWLKKRNTKPCYWKCVDTFNSAATTFSKTAILLTKNKRDRIRWLLFLHSKFWFQRTMVFNILFHWTDKWTMMTTTTIRHSEARFFDRIQVKSCTFISSDAFVTFRYFWSLLLCNSIIPQCTLYSLWLILLLQKSNLFFPRLYFFFPFLCLIDVICFMSYNQKLFVHQDKKWSN